MIFHKISSARAGLFHRTWLSALTLGLVSVLSASAGTIQLGISGNAQVGPNFINFGQFPSGEPYNPAPGNGTFTVSLVNPGIFASAGVHAGQTGSIRSLIMDQMVVQPFMSLQGTLSAVDVYLLGFAQGAFGPFTMTDTPNGAIFFMNFQGVVAAPGDLENFTGTFSATFNGWTAAALIAEEQNGKSVTSPFSATFSAVANPNPAPEPDSLMLIGLGLLFAGMLTKPRWRRGRNKAEKAKQKKPDSSSSAN